MVVQTRKEAWEKVNDIMVSPYRKNEMMSYYNGHPTYDTETNTDTIIDFDIRLQVTVHNKVTNIWIADFIGGKIDKDIEQEAERISNSIILKNAGRDDEIVASNEDKNIIFRIVARALRDAKNTYNITELSNIYEDAGKTLEKEIPSCNGYFTVHIPIKEVITKWQKEGKAGRRKYTFIEESEQETEAEIERKMSIIREQCIIIANDFEVYIEDMREDAAFIYDMPKEDVNRFFTIMQFMGMTRDFMKKGIEIINELSKGEK